MHCKHFTCLFILLHGHADAHNAFLITTFFCDPYIVLQRDRNKSVGKERNVVVSGLYVCERRPWISSSARFYIQIHSQYHVYSKPQAVCCDLARAGDWKRLGSVYLRFSSAQLNSMKIRVYHGSIVISGFVAVSLLQFLWSYWKYSDHSAFLIRDLLVVDIAVDTINRQTNW